MIAILGRWVFCFDRTSSMFPRYTGPHCHRLCRGLIGRPFSGAFAIGVERVSDKIYLLLERKMKSKGFLSHESLWCLFGRRCAVLKC